MKQEIRFINNQPVLVTTRRKLKTWVRITLTLLPIITIVGLYLHTNNQPYTLEQCQYDYRHYNPNYIAKQCGTLAWKGDK